MAKITKNMSQNVTIPRNSHEIYLRLDTPYAHSLSSAGITNSGISRLTKGYEIIRNQPKTHVVLFITSGTMKYKDANRETKDVCSGNLLLLPYKVFEHYWCEGDLEMFWFHLRNSELWSSLGDGGILVKGSEWERELLDSMNRYIDESERDHPDSSLIAEQYALLIASYLKRELEGYRPDERISPQQELLDGLLNLVEQDLAADWTVSKLSSAIFASPSQLHRLCRSIYNSSPMQLVRERRLARAHEILLNTDYPLRTVADIVGYDTPFALSKAFKEAYSISPSAMRRLSKTTKQ